MIGLALALQPARRPGGAPPPPPPLLPAPFQAANADGWTATWASPPALDPHASPVQFSVTRAGFDAAGAPASAVDTLTVMSRLRQPFPNQASLTADQVVLSDFIHAGDTVAGAVNNSTRTPPRPVCMWLQPDMLRATGSVTVRLAVAHMYARSGRPVAAVRFLLSDGANTVGQTVSAMSTVTYAASGLAVPHFAATLSLAGLAANTALTLDAIIYPWVGEAYQASVHGAAPPSISFGRTRVFNDVSYGTAYVHVDAVNGNNATGVASTDPAVAAASPFLSIANACAALRSFNNAGFGRDNVSGGVIRLAAGTHTYASLGTAQTGTMAALPVEIEAADPAARATTVLRDNGASNTTSPARAVFRNITLLRTFGSNLIFIGNGAAAASENFTVFDRCAFDVGTTGSFGSAWIGAPGRVWMLDCTANAPGLGGNFSTSNKVIGVIGGNVGLGGAVYNAAGALSLNRGSFSPAVTGNQEAPLGHFIGFSRLALNSASTPVLSAGRMTGPEGFALVGCILEDMDGTTAPHCALWADGNVQPCQNIVLQMNTVVGERVNFLYQDAGTATVAKSGSVRFCAFTRFNIKTDIFGANASLTGNWPVLNHVGFRANAFLRGSNSGSGFTPGSWLGEVRAFGEVSGTDAAPIAADFLNPQAPGAGNGDYTPGAASALPFVPAGLAPYPVDLLGRAVANDGTARVGAVMAG